MASDAQPEETRTIPFRTGNRLCNDRETGIGPVSPPKAIGDDGDSVPFPIVFPDKNGSGLKVAIEFVGFHTASQPVQELHRYPVEATKRLFQDAVSDHP